MGVHLTEELLRSGYQVTIATRGRVEDHFGDSVKRITIERTDPEDLKKKLRDKNYDLVCDSLAYCSLDVKAVMEAVRCRRYIMISSASVYEEEKLGLKETDFDPCTYPLKWCFRDDYPYDEIKRQAECALFQQFKEQSAAAVRFPYVIGRDDYTQRLYYYVEHIVNGMPLQIDNRKEQLSFIDSDEAGRFLAWLACTEFTGVINASGRGTITPEEIIQYVEQKTGRKGILVPEGEPAPYNGAGSFSLDTELAEQAGFSFMKVEAFIYDLLDYYIQKVKMNS